MSWCFCVGSLHPPAASPFHRVLVLAGALRKVFFERLASWCSDRADKKDDERGLRSTVSCEILASCALWFLAAPPTFPALSSEERKTLVLFGSTFLKVGAYVAIRTVHVAEVNSWS